MTITALVAGARVGVGSCDVAATKAIQTALRAAGHELIVDGGFGKITEAAVKDFHHSHHLAVDGRVGPQTAAALDTAFVGSINNDKSLLHATAMPSAYGVAPWLSIARALNGTKELPGGADNKTIVGWAKEVGDIYPDLRGTIGWYNHDSIPWCGLFTAYCMAKAGFKPPKLGLGAKNWYTDWAGGYRLEHPCPGAVLVKSRAGGGHVTFYESEDSRYYYCRGGNQSDMVNVAAITKNSDLLGFMWPKGGPVPGDRKIGSIAEARAGSEA